MHDDSDIDELLDPLGIDDNPPAAPRHSPPLKPGDIDFVQIHLDDDEVTKVSAADSDGLVAVMVAILSDHKDDFEHLCHYFVDEDARYTLDEGSLEIEDCGILDSGRGTAYCAFTQSFYAGCRDRNVDADPRLCEFDLVLDLAGKTIKVSTAVPPEREPDEF